MVSTGEGWGVNRSNGRGYILGSAVNQDPGGNIDKKSGTIWPIDKKSGMIWPIDNMTAHHHTLLIVQSDLGDYEDNRSSLSRFVMCYLFLVFSHTICNRVLLSNKYKHGPCTCPCTPHTSIYR